MKRFLLAALLALLPLAASAQQAVQQSGSVTPGHAVQWVTTGVVKDGGTAASGSLTSLGVTFNGSGICQNSAATTSAGYQQLCLGTTTAGGGYISVQNFGTATAQGLVFNINGTEVSIPTGGGTIPTLNPPLTNNAIICADGTAGLLKQCFVTVPISAGGTNATTAASARTNLGLGTMAVQDASAVAITGGSITGMANPTTSTDVANKAYVDAAATGLHILTPVRLATAAVLPNTPTYSNGASGVGATLTAGANAALTVDGTSVSAADRILVKNQATAANNGVYTVTTVGDGSTPWVLTRTTDFDTAAEMTAGTYTLVTAGSTNINASYVLQTTVATVGSSAVTFIQFSSTGSFVSSVTIAAGTGISLGGTCTITSTGTCTITNTVSAVTPAGSSGNIQYNNSGSFGGLTDAQVGARITPLALTWTGVNIHGTAAHVYMGSGRPWVDVMSGANGCTAAAVNGSTDDTTAIQCQLNYVRDTLRAGFVIIPATGSCAKVTGTLTVYPVTTVVGFGMGFPGSGTYSAMLGSCISSGGVDITTIQFLGDSAVGNEHSGLRDINIICGTASNAGQNCVFVDTNVPVNFQNVRIQGGYYALATYGVDGRYDNVYATAFATTASSANLFSRGSNNYVNSKFDGGGASFGAYIYAPPTPSSDPMENTFMGVDFSGGFSVAAIAIDDGANPSRQAVTKCIACVIGGTTIINGAQATSFVGTQFGGNITLGANGGTLLINGSMSTPTSVTRTVSGAGTDRQCGSSSNKNITC